MEELSKYGMGGIAVALIGLMALFLKSYSKLAGNHINHNTQALDKLSGAIDKFGMIVDNNTKVMEDVREHLRSEK